MENTETEVWLQFLVDCKYINQEKFLDLSNRCAEVGRMLGYMIQHPDKYL